MLMDIIKARHSIRKYTDEQISRADMDKILEAGNFAPNAGGGQRSMLVGIRNKELTTEIGIMNLAKFDRSRLAGSYVSKEQPSTIDDPTIKNGFYGAPSVVAIFGQNRFMFREADAFCCAENMVLMAAELGVASCIVARGEETFANEFGQALMKQWAVPEGYVARCFVLLGYCQGDYPSPKPRKAGRSLIVEHSEEEHGT
jgi:nitroreductase